MIKQFNDILTNALTDLIDSESITDIDETALNSGEYKITTANLRSIVVNDYIVITGTTGFNGTFKVKSINTGTKSFNILNTAGITIPATFGIWTATKPILIIDSYKHALGLRMQTKNQKYPFIFIPEENLEFKSNQKGSIITTYDVTCTVFVMNQSDHNATNTTLLQTVDDMYDLFNYFIVALNEQSLVIEALVGSISRHLRWGVNFEALPFTEQCSGIEIKNLSLKISNSLSNCKYSK